MVIFCLNFSFDQIRGSCKWHSLITSKGNWVCFQITNQSTKQGIKKHQEIMASSSSSATISSKKYEVFISFRGEDTRCNFVSHLHEALSNKKIETYIDYRLDKGNRVWPSLEEAIEESMVFLIVFSENYASSTWCLNELTKILECSKEEGHHVIPVFYKIDPSHVRKQTGNYEIAFRKHEKSNHKEQVYKWRNALTQVANISGWDSSTYRNEAEFIKEIVNDILMKLELLDHSVYLDGIVGIHEQMAHVESMLMCNQSNSVRFIGIWGMGGIGKTTIAKALFDKLCYAFESFCFLANVREEAEKFGIEHLRNKLLSTVLEDKESYKGLPDGGSSYIRKRLGRKKVLVVLDDVNDFEQLENLAGARNWFGRGSRVIITTRDMQVLNKKVNGIYKVKVLKSDEALQLFKLNAFEDNCCYDEFEHLSRKVVDYAGGIPLAVKILGCFLYGKDKHQWESQLEKLKKMPITKVQHILKLSFDGLDHEEKNIFLFVACFFKGSGVQHIKVLLDACGYSTIIGLRSLQDKALLTISDKKVYMHDLIQEMAFEIVRKESLEDPGKRSRLWDANDIYHVLKDNQGSEAIKSISLDMSKVEELNLCPSVFDKMHKLILLQFYDSKHEGHKLCLPEGLESLPNQLRFLCWDNYPSRSLPSTFSAENLVKLVMQDSEIRNLWQGVQNVVNLKAINLTNCKHLMEVPDFSKAINLEEIYLSNCASLREVHQSILSLDKLRVLWLNHCVALTSLESDIHLRSLRRLSLCDCSNLKKFSVTSENMRTLNLRGTSINELPSLFTRPLIKLERLYVDNCSSLKHIDCNFFGGLKSLKELHLNGCNNMFELIDHISLLLPSLNRLSIKGSIVESLPTSIKNLSSLQCLKLVKCKKLQSLSQLPPSIKSLLAIDCSSLKTVQFASTIDESSEGLKEYKNNTSFLNCMELDEHSVKDILAKAMVHIMKSLPEKDNGDDKDENYQVQVKYPGRSVPEWFKYRTMHPSVIVDLSSAPLSEDWALLFCFIAPPSLINEGIWIKCSGKMRITYSDCANDETEKRADLVKLGSCRLNRNEDVRKLRSDHVFLWFDHRFCSVIHQKIKESRTTSNPKISLEVEFHRQLFDNKNRQRQWKKIKGCGVCPTYASECQNFIKEMKLDSQVSSSARGVGCSYVKEEVPPKQNSKCSNFPPLPSATNWKNGTQGLKDIINL